MFYYYKYLYMSFALLSETEHFTNNKQNNINVFDLLHELNNNKTEGFKTSPNTDEDLDSCVAKCVSKHNNTSSMATSSEQDNTRMNEDNDEEMDNTRMNEDDDEDMDNTRMNEDDDEEMDNTRMNEDGDEDMDNTRMNKDGDEDMDNTRMNEDGDEDMDNTRMNEDGDEDMDNTRMNEDDDEEMVEGFSNSIETFNSNNILNNIVRELIKFVLLFAILYIFTDNSVKRYINNLISDFIGVTYIEKIFYGRFRAPKEYKIIYILLFTVFIFLMMEFL
jgi:hypothetical protein